MTIIAADPEAPAASAAAEAALAVVSAAAAAMAVAASPVAAADAGNKNISRIRGKEKCQSKKDAHISAAWG